MTKITTMLRNHNNMRIPRLTMMIPERAVCSVPWCGVVRCAFAKDDLGNCGKDFQQLISPPPFSHFSSWSSFFFDAFSSFTWLCPVFWPINPMLCMMAAAKAKPTPINVAVLEMPDMFRTFTCFWQRKVRGFVSEMKFLARFPVWGWQHLCQYKNLWVLRDKR